MIIFFHTIRSFFSIEIMLSVLMSISLGGIVLAQDTLVWDPPGNVKNIEGYRVYYGDSSRKYPESEEASNQTSILLDFLPVNKTHYLAVVAYDSKGNESAYSNEVVYTNYLSGNPPPVAVDDLITITKDIQIDINVIANDSAPNGTIVPSTVTLVRFSSHGTTTNNWDGTVTYIPDLGYSGKDSFTYTVQDNFGATSNKATVIVTIRSSDIPAMTSPAPSSTLTTSTVIFQWNAGNQEDLYRLHVGTTGPGSTNIRKQNGFPQTSLTVTGIPQNGTTVYVRLWYRTGGDWSFINYVYQTGSGNTYPTSNTPAMTSPTPSSTLTTSTVAFQWDAGTQENLYRLHVGTTGPGSKNIRKQNGFTQTSLTVTGVPINGATVYVRLWYRIGSKWSFIDYTYRS